MTDHMNTPFRRELEHRFLNEKKLSPNSVKLYIRNLEKLNGNEPLRNFAFLKDVDAIEKSLERYAENTKRAYLISICSALSTDKATKPKQKLYDQYFQMMVEKNKMLKTEEAKNEKSDKQKENWAEWKEIEDTRDKLADKVKTLTGKELSDVQYNTLLAHLVLSLYTYLPPRRNEYRDMFLVKSGAASLPTTTNYIEFDSHKLLLNRFKTAKKEGTVTIEIPDELWTVIEKYIRYHPLLKGKKVVKATNVPFLVYADGSPLSKVNNSITRILNRVFGKNIGSSQLRHIYLSSKYGDKLEEMKEDAQMMSHSVAQQKDYIKTK